MLRKCGQKVKGQGHMVIQEDHGCMLLAKCAAAAGVGLYVNMSGLLHIVLVITKTVAHKNDRFL